jgi:hypothetical protein
MNQRPADNQGAPPGYYDPQQDYQNNGGDDGAN